jgi:hypothetical protein
MWFSSVVLPAPRKPEMIVAGTGAEAGAVSVAKMFPSMIFFTLAQAEPLPFFPLS